ncbi:MAG: MarR family transcriptional regulator [Planctomycetota bacterium]
MDHSGLPADTEDRASAGEEGRQFRFLRFSHIFASAVREILEEEILREVSPAPLSRSQFRVLKLMALDGPHQVGEVAELLAVSPPAATKNIDKLERLGLVVRTPFKGDRRATLVSISPEAHRLVREYEKVKAARLAPLLASFRPAEIEQACHLLERLSISLLAEKRSGSEGCLRCAAYFERDCPIGRIRGGCLYQKIREARPDLGDEKGR